MDIPSDEIDAIKPLKLTCAIWFDSKATGGKIAVNSCPIIFALFLEYMKKKLLFIGIA